MNERLADLASLNFSPFTDGNANPDPGVEVEIVVSNRDINSSSLFEKSFVVIVSLALYFTLCHNVSNWLVNRVHR